jgi:hypothetical protein
VTKQLTLTTDDAKHQFVYPKFFYFVPPPLRVYPAKIIFDPTRLKRANTFEINAKSSMDMPIGVLDLRLYGTRKIEYALTEKVKDKHYVIVVKLPKDFAPAPNDRIYFSFRVKNDPDKKLYTIPVEPLKTEK